MDTKFSVRKMYVFPKKGDNVNVVGKVDWAVTFSRNGVTSTGVGETLLGTDNIEYFVPIDEITENVVIQWVIAKEGGQQFIQRLQQIHEPNLQYQEKMAGMVEWEFADKAIKTESPTETSAQTA